MEIHLIQIHGKKKEYKCNKCDSSFLLKWRLKKHNETHTKEQIRTCHYFNNNSECPFSEIGCKFLHVKSSKCKYGGQCKAKLCQYSHK